MQRLKIQYSQILFTHIGKILVSRCSKVAKKKTKNFHTVLGENYIHKN